MRRESKPTRFERQAGETNEAFDAFCKYRDLGVGRRSLAEVTRMLRAEARERRGLSATLILPPEFENPTADEQPAGYTEATRRPKNSGNHSGQVGRWAKKYSWVERASAWDDHLDARNRERQLDEITKMAKRHAEQIEVALGVVIQPIREFMKSLQDRGRADMRTESSMKLLDTSLEAMRTIPRLQEAERIARGVRVKSDSEGSPQGGDAVWEVVVYQPPRTEPAADFTRTDLTARREWDGDRVQDEDDD